jgi:hypothetical protein
VSGRYTVQVAAVLLVVILAVLVAATWYTIGAMTEGHLWRHRFYTVATAIFAVLVLGFLWYVGFGSGRIWLQ